MVAVIGLKSGKEFIVQDESFLFVDDKRGSQARVFISLDEKRIITVPAGGIDTGNVEYFDEQATEETLKELRASGRLIREQSVENKLPSDDPNVA